MRRRARGSPLPQKPGAAIEKLHLARAMRAAPTDGEAVLWAALRRRGMGGWKFRRQQVIAGYIVDFYCAELWLAIEVDGPVHEERVAEDRRRDAALGELGVLVVRVSNGDVIGRLAAVVESLRQHLAEGVHRQRFRPPR